MTIDLNGTVKKVHIESARLRVIFAVFLSVLSLIAGCRGCKKTTEPPEEEWDPRNVSRNEGFSGAPSLGLDLQGNVHIAWMDSTPGNYEICYTVKYQGQSWQEPMNISNTSEESASPSLAVDSQGNVHVVWVEYRGSLMEKVVYSKRDAAGLWSVPQQVSTGQWPHLPQIGVDGEGNVHAIWMEAHIYYANRAPGGVWSTPTEISSYASWNPSLCVTGQGYVHAVWEMSYIGGNEEVFYAEKPPVGSWSEPMNISGSSQWYSWEAQITADEEENVCAVWVEEEKSTLYFSMKSADGSWSEPDSLGATTAYPGRPLFSSIAVGPEGSLHLVWDRRLSNSDISYMRKLKHGVWSESRNISNTPGTSRGPCLNVDTEGTAHIAWGDETPGNWEIYYDEIE